MQPRSSRCCNRVMFVERSESFDGSPQPLAVESIAKTSAGLELIIALIPAIFLPGSTHIHEWRVGAV